MLRSIHRFHRHQSGSTFILTAFAIFALLAAVGTAVDVGRGQLMQSKLQNAVDAAGLAAGGNVNSETLNADVRKYINLNFSTNLMGATLGNVTHTVSEDGKILTVTAEAQMPTTFMGLFGHDTMDLAATTEITRSNKGMELVLVLDTTGSMAGSKLTALKSSALKLVDILFGTGKTTAENLWIGVVPFSQAVNIGPSHTNWLDAAHYATLDWRSTHWAGCVEARYTGRDITDDPYNLPAPNTEPFKAYYWADDTYNNWVVNSSTDSTSSTDRVCTRNSNCKCSNYNNCNCTTTSTSTTSGSQTTTVATRVCHSCNGSGSNRNCDRTTTVTTTVNSSVPFDVIDNEHGPNRYCPSEVTRLTGNRADIEAGINSLAARGATHIPTGAVWGWRMLSPRWRGLWGGSMNAADPQLPLDYDTDLMVKAAIIMTDGENTMYNNIDGAYGYLNQNQLGTTNSGQAATALNTKVTNICNAMKAKGIIVYTIVFDLTGGGNVETMMKNCASDPSYYFNSPTEQTLTQAFTTIGDSLANLRISH